jgi:carbonic anhydrase
MNMPFFPLKKNHLKNDILASLIVFFVAIPLCLGIALASGAPLFSGIITGVVGGIVVGILSESPVSVSGPAAGMIAVVATAMNQLGSYEAFLLALVFAGLLQVLSGLLRAGFIADFVPSNVILGLLAAIGILIVIKQLPVALGYSLDGRVFLDSLKEAQGDFSIAPLLHLLTHINKGSVVITVISLTILLTFEKIFHKISKIIPASIVVVIVAIIMNQFFIAFYPPLSLQAIHLVNIPTNETFSDFISQLRHPDWSSWKNINVYIYAGMMAIVASLETLLNLEAAEKLDENHHYCSRNRELIAQGIGNMISGSIGGLPITSVIVRSSVNINAGVKTKASTILHGIWLLLSISLISELLNSIPLAALSAILIHTGYKLARISVFNEAYKQGFRYFIPFIITVIAIVFTNLLLGIILGLFVSIFFMLQHNSKNTFTMVDEIHPSGEILRLILPQQVTFLNKAAMVKSLNSIPRNAKVIIDAKFSDYIDKDILIVVKQFNESQAADKNILVNLEGFKDSYDIANQTNFINVTTYDVQATLDPGMILKILREGNLRFMNDISIHKNHNQKVTATSRSQYPLAVVLSCIDSRVPVEIIFDLTLGDLFVIRVAGNIANADILGSLEFACHIAGAKLIIVLGHKECGAIKAACDKDWQVGYIEQLLEKITPAIQQETSTHSNRNSQNEIFLLNVIRNNIQNTKEFIYQQSQILQSLIDTQQIGLIGALYDIATGHVEFEEKPNGSI